MEVTSTAGGASIPSQLTGGIAAAFTYSVMHLGSGFPLEPGAQNCWSAALSEECIFTFVLCFMVPSVAP